MSIPAQCAAPFLQRLPLFVGRQSAVRIHSKRLSTVITRIIYRIEGTDLFCIHCNYNITEIIGQVGKRDNLGGVVQCTFPDAPIGHSHNSCPSLRKDFRQRTRYTPTVSASFVSIRSTLQIDWQGYLLPKENEGREHVLRNMVTFLLARRYSC